MGSTPERSYGARIGNAEKMLTALQSFTNYHAPHPELEIAALDGLIDEIKALNRGVASAKQDHSLAIVARMGLYESADLSIDKALVVINANVMATFGKKSQESAAIHSLVKKARGTNRRAGKNPDDESISRSYQSYNSIVQFFADVVVHLTRFEADGNYIPSDPRLTIASLNAQYEAAVAANNLVVGTYSNFKQVNGDRVAKYAFLADLCKRLKYNVLSQYGKNSAEYALIRTFVV